MVIKPYELDDFGEVLKKTVDDKILQQTEFAQGTLSICMIVKNEGTRLQGCLASIASVADQIVVVDTGSTDDTATIARAYGALVVFAPWRNDFAFSRNVSLGHATSSWIIWLDGDDLVPESSLALIARLKREPANCVYSFIVRNERPGNTGTEFSQARMFPNRPDIRFERRIHEQMMPSALRLGLILKQTTAVVEHHGYADPVTLRKKASRNVTLLLEEYDQHQPDTVTAIEIADSYQLMEDDDHAVAWYKVALAQPSCVSQTPTLAGHALMGMGTILTRKSAYAEAIKNFRKARELTPWRSDLLYSLAVALELSGEVDEAVETLRTIFVLQPRAGQVGVDFRAAKIKAYLRLVRILVETNRLDAAGAAVADAVVAVGQRPEILSMAGKVFLKLGNLMDALHAFEKSLALRADGNFDAFIGLCCIYRLAGKNERVAETLQAIEPMFAGEERYVVARYCLLEKNSLPEPLQESCAALQRDFFGLL